MSIPITTPVMQPHLEPSNAGLDLGEDVTGYGASNVTELRNNARAMDKVASLYYTHPDYDAHIEKWNKYMDLYSADNIYKYIYRHPRETQESWEARVKRAYFYNYAASVIDLFVSYLFSTDISRAPTNDPALAEELNGVEANADLKGTTYDAFMRIAAAIAQAIGWVGVLVDAPGLDDGILSELDRKEKGLRPYLKMILPQQLLDWSTDKFGKYEWVKIEVPVVDGRTYEQSVDFAERRFLIWDRAGWELWSVVRVEGSEPEAKLLDDGDSPATLKGFVPFVVLRNQPMVKHAWFGESSIRDIADINIALMNWSSFGDEEIANRCLNILTMERDNNNQIQALISHCNILEYTPGSEPPSYLTPGTTPLDLIGQWIDRARDEIYRIAKLGGSTGLSGAREATSGIAYAYEFNETNQSLTSKAAMMETGETEIFKLISRWLGKEFTGSVTYSRDFGVDDFLLELDTIMKGRVAFTSVTAIRQMEKNVANKMFARRPLAFRKKIEEEIDAAPAIPLAVGNFDSVSPAQVSGTAGG